MDMIRAEYLTDATQKRTAGLICLPETLNGISVPTD